MSLRKISGLQVLQSLVKRPDRRLASAFHLPQLASDEDALAGYSRSLDTISDLLLILIVLGRVQMDVLGILESVLDHVLNTASAVGLVSACTKPNSNLLR